MHQTSRFMIEPIELFVHLGWEEVERLQPQKILLRLDIDFAVVPKACQTDDLNDTVCYATLIAHCKQFIQNKSFRLVEHLTVALYDTLKPLLPKEARLNLHLTKYPPIPDFAGHVTFCYGDHP
jgi:dihydroneopterin aldolase